MFVYLFVRPQSVHLSCQLAGQLVGWFGLPLCLSSLSSLSKVSSLWWSVGELVGQSVGRSVDQANSRSVSLSVHWFVCPV